MSLIQIYQRLYDEFGPQGWWPLSKEGVHSKHHNGPPTNEKDVFEIIIGAILTQNTNWKNVEKALHNLSKNNLIDIKKIKQIKKERLAEIIMPSGYYNQKAERLKLVAGFLSENKIDDLKKLSANELRGAFLKLKGIGPETADSIALYAFEKPTFVIDAYTKRIMFRMGLSKKDADYNDLQKFFFDSFKNISYNKKTKIFKEDHALLVELAKQSCRAEPLCAECVLKSVCKKQLCPESR